RCLRHGRLLAVELAAARGRPGAQLRRTPASRARGPAHRIPSRPVAGTGVADARLRARRCRGDPAHPTPVPRRTHPPPRTARMAGPAAPHPGGAARRDGAGVPHARAAHVADRTAHEGGLCMSLVELRDVTVPYGDAI